MTTKYRDHHLTIRNETHSDHRKTARRALATGQLYAGVCHGAAEAGGGVPQRLDGVIDRWVASERIVGVTAFALRDGEPVDRRAAEFADREAGRPARKDRIYRLASMTKAITSATALALVDAGGLSLDDRVTDWLAEFRPSLPDGRPPDMTVRQLLRRSLVPGVDGKPGNVGRRARPCPEPGSDRTIGRKSFAGCRASPACA